MTACDHLCHQVRKLQTGGNLVVRNDRKNTSMSYIICRHTMSVFRNSVILLVNADTVFLLLLPLVLFTLVCKCFLDTYFHYSHKHGSVTALCHCGIRLQHLLSLVSAVQHFTALHPPTVGQLVVPSHSLIHPSKTESVAHLLQRVNVRTHTAEKGETEKVAVVTWSLWYVVVACLSAYVLR